MLGALWELVRAVVLAVGVVLATQQPVAPGESPPAATEQGPPSSGQVTGATGSAGLPVAERPEWWDGVHSPSYLTRLGDKYFLVDTWHNRVLWSRSLEVPVGEWAVLDREIASPHSIDGDGSYVAVEDTHRDAVNFYAFRGGRFVLVDRVEEVGLRPHRVRFDEGLFKVLAADSGEMVHFRVEDDRAEEVERVRLPTIDPDLAMHIRSFTLRPDEVWFTATLGQERPQVIVTDRDYRLIRVVEVAAEFADMNDLFPVDGKIIVTATFQTVTVVDDLDDLAVARNRWSEFGFAGTPYYPSVVDGRLFIPEATEYSRISTWRLDGDALTKGTDLVDTGPPTAADLLEKERFW